MQKLAEFIVGKRRAILVVSLVLTLVSALAMTTVAINKDLTRYLPADSVARQGIDAMNAEFDETIPLRVMLEGLSPDEVDDVAADLEALPDVSGVMVTEGEDGTPSQGKTLFTVNLTGSTYSDTARAGLEEVRGYADESGFDAAIAGTVLDSVEQMKTLAYTIVFAVAMLLAILFVMCSSWVEPLLFLLTIAIAILLNMGTNVVFPSISETTFSIAAVLQLALSMDYSIMLTDRYRQERLVETDKERAMVNALKTGFTSISASSVTTIAGMLCLVAMSFTIGRDMGLVLAKGVFFSVLCVLVVLPGLMVACDGAIQKTRKPYPKPALGGLARFSHAWRYVILAVFVALMVGGFAAKGAAGITYFMDSSNPDEEVINEAFPATSQVVVLYDKDADGVDEVLADIAARDDVESVASYGETLGKPLTADEMADALDMDPSVLGLLYYVDANGTQAGPRGVADFARIVEQDVAGNPAFADALDAELLDQVGVLQTLGDPDKLARQRTADEVAELLGVDAGQAGQLYLYYHVEQGDLDLGTTTLGAFTALVEQVAADETFGALVDEDSAAQMGRLAALTDPEAVTTPLSAAELAQALGMEQDQVEQIFTLKSFAARGAGGGTASNEMSVQDFLTYVLDVMANTSMFQNAVDEEQLAGLYQARALVDAAAAGTELDSFGVAELLGMDPAQVEQVRVLGAYLNGGRASWTLDLATVVPFMADVLGGDAAGALADGVADASDEQRDQLAMAAQIVEGALDGATYTADEMADLLGSASASGELTADRVALLYLLGDSVAQGDPGQTLTLDQFVTFAAHDVVDDELFSDVVDDAARTELADAEQTMADAKSQFVGTAYARAIIETPLSRSDAGMADLVGALHSALDATGATYYLVGDGPMGVEMSETFGDEFNFITLLTAAVIFLIVALTFRNVAVALILVLLIQTAVNLTMGLAALSGVGTYYIALMIVQALLMGATIDYAILFTTYYRDARRTADPAASLACAFKGSVGTIMTSSSILILVLAVVGFTSSDVTMAEVCLTLSKGSLVAVTLVMLLLPGTLAALDRVTAGRNALRPAKKDDQQKDED